MALSMLSSSEGRFALQQLTLFDLSRNRYLTLNSCLSIGFVLALSSLLRFKGKRRGVQGLTAHAANEKPGGWSLASSGC